MVTDPIEQAGKHRFQEMLEESIRQHRFGFSFELNDFDEINVCKHSTNEYLVILRNKIVVTDCNETMARAITLWISPCLHEGICNAIKITQSSITHVSSKREIDTKLILKRSALQEEKVKFIVSSLQRKYPGWKLDSEETLEILEMETTYHLLVLSPSIEWSCTVNKENGEIAEEMHAHLIPPPMEEETTAYWKPVKW